MRKTLSTTVFASLLVGFSPAPVRADQKALTIEDVKKIVREELKAREQELNRREKALEQRERAVAEREAETSVAAKSVITREESSQTVSLPVDEKVVRAPGPFALELSGYGDIQADFYDFEESIDQPDGSRGSSKTTFDTERFVLEVEAKHEPSAIEVEAEIEFEHGGTGAAQEIEFEEFGEIENEVEKGGEVIIEELYVEKDFGEGFSGKLGRFYIALGTLSYYYRPTDYLAVRRPEVEEVMLPGQWDEIGLSLEKELDFGSITFQVVNGLDSTGFNSTNWIAEGHQSRFEGVRAEDLALVGRLDLDSLYPGFLIGGSVYAGNTTGNRPKDDLDSDGTVVLGSVNYRYWDTAFKTQGAVYIGHLNDADEITDRNSRLSNTLGVDRTPVSDEALGLWVEAGYNISPLIGVTDKHDLSPFARFDYYDTGDSDNDTGRFERMVYTLGLAYIYDDFLTLKLNGSIRDFGDSDIDDQQWLGLGAGFVY